MSGPTTVVAADLGGTTIKAARINTQGIAEETLRVPTPVRAGSETVLAAVAETAAMLTRPGTVAVGLCAPGLIDRAAGAVRFAGNIKPYDAPLARTVADRTHLPVTFEHDVRAATLAEQRLGRGNGCQDLLVVVLGTGMAAGIVNDGILTSGYRRSGKDAESAADVTARLKTDPATAGVWADATDALGSALAMTTVLSRRSSWLGA